ncbi:MAG: hypothetical protein IPL23_26770 [Saprospiraceae bacterium]|nr:hypothetical protein [Saprospiraceae bacterium]
MRSRGFLLPLTYPASETGRVTKGAALGLAAKIALVPEKLPRSCAIGNSHQRF